MLIFCLGPNMLTHHRSRYFHTHGCTAVDFRTSRHEDRVIGTPSNLAVCDDQGINLGATLPGTFGAGSSCPLDGGGMAWIPVQDRCLSSFNKGATQQLFRFWSKQKGTCNTSEVTCRRCSRTLSFALVRSKFMRNYYLMPDWNLLWKLPNPLTKFPIRRYSCVQLPIPCIFHTFWR